MGDKPLISLALEDLPLADYFKMVQAYWDPRQAENGKLLQGCSPPI